MYTEEKIRMTNYSCKEKDRRGRELGSCLQRRIFEPRILFKEFMKYDILIKNN